MSVFTSEIQGKCLFIGKIEKLKDVDLLEYPQKQDFLEHGSWIFHAWIALNFQYMNRLSFGVLDLRPFDSTSGSI